MLDFPELFLYEAHMDKEELKKRRKEAYQKAKEKRDADPSFQAYKEAQKQKRKDAYRAHKEKVKAQKEGEKKRLQEEKDAALAEAFGLTEKLRLLKFD